jgi:hypothetical protein
MGYSIHIAKFAAHFFYIKCRDMPTPLHLHILANKKVNHLLYPGETCVIETFYDKKEHYPSQNSCEE